MQASVALGTALKEFLGKLHEKVKEEHSREALLRYGVPFLVTLALDKAQGIQVCLPATLADSTAQCNLLRVV